MPLPEWNDPGLRAGTMIRTALWLVSEIGLGNTFSKEQHRQVFSGVTQADRRLRDLRTFGWIIHTSSEDVSLNSNEQRLVTVGLHVWEPGIRKPSLVRILSAKERMAVFAKTDYRCCVCGIAGGENYSDAPQMTAVLSVSKRDVAQVNGSIETEYLPECKRCRAGTRGVSDDIMQVLAKIEQLDSADRAAILRLIVGGTDGQLTCTWTDFRRLSEVARCEVRRHLTTK